MGPVMGTNIAHIYLPPSLVPTVHTFEDNSKENIGMLYLDGSVGFKKQRGPV